MKPELLATLFFACLVGYSSSYGSKGYDPLGNIIRAKRSRASSTYVSTSDSLSSGPQQDYSPVYVGPQDGLMGADKIEKLPGQPDEVKFDQYSGYVTVDPNHGRALFYYFVEAPENASSKPLVLWLNGGPGCSSLGNGAMMELGPFRVNSDGKTLYQNPYAWNKLANVLFLESPAGVGFSYSNTSSDYDLPGDKKTAHDSYIFLVNWLERFPQYKSRDFYITGESYAGHYVPQLAQHIVHSNKITNQTVINLKGIAIGNAWIDDATSTEGMYDFFWTHALISDEVYEGIRLNCNFSSPSNVCNAYLDQADSQTWDIYIYNVYASWCSSTNASWGTGFDPCSDDYIFSYLNLPEVQKSLHANVTGLPGPWDSCNFTLHGQWADWEVTILPTIQHLMQSGLSVWIYSGDTDGRVPVTSSKLSIDKISPSIKTPWYPWETEEEVGGYAVGYENLTFVTVRGAGHFVPSYQPARALTLFSSFLENKLPPKIT